MSNLALLQQQFLALLQSKDQEFYRLVTDQPPVKTATRLGIYKNAYVVRLRETIDNDHPILGLYLGDELYDLMVGRYIAAYPSNVKSLRHFCQSLPIFLAQEQPFSDYPILTKLAEFERLLLDVFDASDAVPKTMVDLQQVGVEKWPSLTLEFHPSCAIFGQKINAVESWQALKAQHPPPSPVSSANTIYWLLWRNPTRLTEFYHLAEPEYQCWQHFYRGGTFGSACELLGQYYEEQQVPTEALILIQKWLNGGMISELVS